MGKIKNIATSEQSKVLSKYKNRIRAVGRGQNNAITKILNEKLGRKDALINSRKERINTIKEMQEKYAYITRDVLNDKTLNFLIQQSNINAPTFTSILAGFELARKSSADKGKELLDASTNALNALSATDATDFKLSSDIDNARIRELENQRANQQRVEQGLLSAELSVARQQDVNNAENNKRLSDDFINVGNLTRDNTSAFSFENLRASNVAVTDAKDVTSVEGNPLGAPDYIVNLGTQYGASPINISTNRDGDDFADNNDGNDGLVVVDYEGGARATFRNGKLVKLNKPFKDLTVPTNNINALENNTNVQQGAVESLGLSDSSVSDLVSSRYFGNNPDNTQNNQSTDLVIEQNNNTQLDGLVPLTPIDNQQADNQQADNQQADNQPQQNLTPEESGFSGLSDLSPDSNILDFSTLDALTPVADRDPDPVILQPIVVDAISQGNEVNSDISVDATGVQKWLSSLGYSDEQIKNIEIQDLNNLIESNKNAINSR